MSRQGRAAAWIRRHRNGLSIALTVALIVVLFGAWHAFTTPTFVDTAYGPMPDVVGGNSLTVLHAARLRILSHLPVCALR